MNEKDFCRILGFQPKENSSGIYQKKYEFCDDYTIEVDFVKEKINYGNLIQAESKTTQNFSQKENFVVLECVDRLLTKGYKPQNIILEKTWPAGHGNSGRLDICVTREDGSEYMLIECKTYGKEFDKEFAKIKKDGGQLFTYFKFSNKPDVIMLYASELRGKEIVYRNEIVKIEDDYRIGDKNDFYEKWSKLTKDNGVFESWVNPYDFKSRALTIKDLDTIKLEDSSFIFNRFLEILRHNVVSDKPNAFNKIFTLFLCKIYDEKDKEGRDEELDFQWREGIDDDVSFQLRLTDLYKNGMKEFLEKHVTDFSETEFENKYKNLDQSVKTALLQEFKKIRLEKNNEFAIKEVYDEKSFKENAVVVKQVVELLQKYKIRYAKKQQYLSDFFELLLTTGLKQESGQFFTPVPIAQFIIKSLPIDDLVKTKLQEGKRGELLPYIIDYAAGSGHFITESMHEIQRLLDKIDITKLKMEAKSSVDTWKIRHFDWALQYIYGIEKDYRLVKVGKVGCYLHGDGLANVMHSDGLSRFTHPDYKLKLKETDKDFPQENKQFDVVVSNPPYSVSAFKNAAREYYGGEDFTLHGKLTDNSSEIECLFIERTKQLLKDGGVAGIILPSSILSNSGIYTKAREIILQYFDIIAITELGSNTFMATGTNTVVLFLRRRNNYDSINLKKSVNHFFSTFVDVTLNGIEKPVAKFVSHVWEGVSFNDYLTFLKKAPNNIIEEHEIYKEYRKKIKAKTEKEFWSVALENESEKLYYFIIACPQKIVLVKSGEKDAEKRFLGYEFSNRRGSEGIHPVQRGRSIDECTKLYDADSFENPEKASAYIYKAFKGDRDFEIHEDLKNNITRLDLVDMLSFDRADFEKTISLAVKKKVKIESKWEIIPLINFIEIIGGGTPSTNVSEYWNGTIPWLSVADFNNGNRFVEKTEKCITEQGLKNSSAKYINAGDIIISARGTVGALAQLRIPMTFNQSCYGLRGNDMLDNGFLYYMLKSEIEQLKNGSYGSIFKAITTKTFSDIKIPLPPKDIQQKIVAEIEMLEKNEEEAKLFIREMKGQLAKICSSYFEKSDLLIKIQDITKLTQYGISKGLNTYDKGYKIFRMNEIINGKMVDNGKMKHVDISEEEFLKFKLEKGDILFNRTNSIELVGKTGIFDLNGDYCFASYLIRLKVKKEKAVSKFVNLLMNSDVFLNNARSNASKAVKQANINAEKLRNFYLPIPPIEEQKKIVAEIELLENQIFDLEKQIADIPKKKEQVLNKYLN